MEKTDTFRNCSSFDLNRSAEKTVLPPLGASRTHPVRVVPNLITATFSARSSHVAAPIILTASRTHPVRVALNSSQLSRTVFDINSQKCPLRSALTGCDSQSMLLMNNCYPSTYIQYDSHPTDATRSQQNRCAATRTHRVRLAAN